MGDNNGSRSGSLQFYPRVRAKKVIPQINWGPVKRKDVGLLGFLGYKVGMVSAWAKDDTPDSMMKGKRVAVPATVIECPAMRIYAVRFYKNNTVLADVVVSNEAELKRKTKLPKTVRTLTIPEGYDEVRTILYSHVKKTSIGKKKPDMIEVGLQGTNEEKIRFIQERIGKDILATEVLDNELVDVRGVTRGHGTQGPVKRFGITLKNHKSEKGVRRPGSLSSFGLRRVTFRAPQAGQTGYHNRTTYNNLIIEIGTVKEKDINPRGGFEHYGVIKNEYIVLRGSVPGPKKRGLVITPAIRPTKKQSKKKFEVLELR